MNATPTSADDAVATTTARFMIDRATRKEDSPFDFIIVGSGAGGGPLACRLAEAGKKVLLIEAGQDPATAGDVHNAPLFHPASTEHPDLSWQFSVRHYQNTARQQTDQKYDPAHDDPKGTGGIFYPRSSGLGGCTSHHAMIVVKPNDSDWEQIADFTNDDSWRAKNMQPYFAKFEKCLYIDEYRGFLANLLGWAYKAWFAFVRLVNPKLVLDQAGHGSDGWQPTSFIAPTLIQKIVKTDNELTTVLIESAFKVIKKDSSLTALLKRYLIMLGFVRSFDPNDDSTRAASADGGVFLIPTGIGGEKTVDPYGAPHKGYRTGLREFILKTQKDHPDFLVIVSGVHATRVLFGEGGATKAPRAIGVAGIQGEYLYKASPKSQPSKGKPVEFFVRHKTRHNDDGKATTSVVGEVILSGGSFNTPQLLMLSGIGDEGQIKEINQRAPENEKITFRVQLPGVGLNLQDRYEVGVISEFKKPLVSLDTINFKPGDPSDLILREWIEKKEGLYATNGGTITILHRSSVADKPEPDLFTFGAPAAFRGYYWGWSTELLKATKGAANEQRDLWSWVILKAYTRNNGGTVRLRSANPFDTPIICFHSFDEGAISDWEKDVTALAEAVKTVQRINDGPDSPFGEEIQPRQYLAQKNAERRKANIPEWKLEEWIKNEAWGHHACGTCRMGSDSWKEYSKDLTDKKAVIDSRFRVHGVEGLRVVDASIFPKIPGYFILAPIFMVSEKAASVILHDYWEDNYPGKIRAVEEQAIRNRRARAWVDHKNCMIPPDLRPDAARSPTAKTLAPESKPEEIEGSVGVALSGGGIRSATFCLGVLQALAAKGRLRHIDYLSSVSGGGFIGSFLGRLFTRERVAGVPDPCGRAQDILKNDRSGPLRWLRAQSDYLFSSGESDWFLALGVFFRNLFTVHLVIGALLFAVFASLAGLSRLPLYHRLLPTPVVPYQWTLSPWWWVPVAMLGLVILPMMLGYWLAPKPRSYRSNSPYPFAAWLILSAAAAVGWVLPSLGIWAFLTLIVLGLAWVWQEAARLGPPQHASSLPMEGEVARNRLTRSLGEALIVFLASVAWVILDSAATTFADVHRLPEVMAGLAALAPVLQVLRAFAGKALRKSGNLGASILLKIIVVILALALLFIVDFIAHCLFQMGDAWLQGGFILIALLFSIVLGPALDFLNYSSLLTAYSAHITRAFLGASNEARTTANDAAGANVQTVLPGDDIPHYLYRPEENGGPLHLISVCVNETVDQASQREDRDRKGLLMTVGSFGVSVGRRFFATWTPSVDPPWWMRLRRWIEGTNCTIPPPPALQAVRLNAGPNTFHPLARRDQKPAVVKTLSLGNWAAVSGAAFSTGAGRNTSPFNALLFGLLNLRLGYWWDSGILASERPGRFPPNLWVRLTRLPATLFQTQSLLLSEWRGLFHGPSREFWNLTDGGEQDNTAIYELIRRRVPFIIAVDAVEDLNYTFEAIANLERMVRVDFGVEINWQPNAVAAPKHVLAWIDAAKVGSIQDIKGNPANGKRGTTHAALARVDYTSCPGYPSSWLVLIKASLTGDESLDVTEYAALHENFPQDSTLEQTFNDEQWESYRKLAYTTTMNLIQ